jgi:hypothetical protein
MTDLRKVRRTQALIRLLLVPSVLCLSLGLSVTAAVGLARSAGADPLGSCTTSTGVVVAVDFSPWGGNVERGCSLNLANGLSALAGAGFRSAGDTHDGPAFVCRVYDGGRFQTGEPSPSEDPCQTTPPATAFWSYWHADAGQSSWTFSQLGAASYRPPPGSVDAWTFGGSEGQPSFSPDLVRASNSSATGGSSPSVEPTTTTTTNVIGDSSSVHGATGPAGVVSGTQSGSGSTSTMPSENSTTTTLSDQPSPAVSKPSSPRVVAVVPTASRTQSAGSPAPLIVGGIVAAVLIAVAGASAWRRRRTG